MTLCDCRQSSVFFSLNNFVHLSPLSPDDRHAIPSRDFIDGALQVIQLILRKTTPESLRAYSRLGFSENASWTTRAATATYSAAQVANFHALSDADPMKAFIDGGFGAAPARSTPAPRGTSQSNMFATGAKVLVPATVYPSYPCRENEGRGWTATVLQRSRDAVRLEFTSADASGTVFQPVWLKSAVLIATA